MGGFIEGLAYSITHRMAREVETKTSFTLIVEIARRIYLIHRQGSEALSDKRPHHIGGFSGASYGGRLVLN